MGLYILYLMQIDDIVDFIYVHVFDVPELTANTNCKYCSIPWTNDISVSTKTVKTNTAG